MRYHVIVGVLLLVVLTESGRIRRNIFGGTVPPGATCLFNPCVHVQNYCKNQGNCSLNETTCQYKCICQEGFEGRRCEFTVQSTTKEAIILTSESGTTDITTLSVVTTLRPLSERQCFLGFVCEHGYCDKSAFSCICDFGWQGPFCNTGGKCPLTCDDGKTCVILQNSYFCAITNTTHQPTTTIYIHTTPISTSGTSEQSPTALTTPEINGQSETYGHVCSANYTKRPLIERTCIPNFVCQHGRCEKVDLTDSFRLGCICDEGGIGIFCDHTCCFNCTEHGACNKLANGTEFCNCQHGYSGEFCEIILDNRVSSGRFIIFLFENCVLIQ